MNRDEVICEAYKSGQSLKEIGETHSISRERVRQILRRNKIFKGDRPVERSGRDEFLGVNLTEEDKAALREEAARRGVSMSSLTSDLIREMLAGREVAS